MGKRVRASRVACLENTLFLSKRVIEKVLGPEKLGAVLYLEAAV
jgi:hypothetical protein